MMKAYILTVYPSKMIVKIGSKRSVYLFLELQYAKTHANANIIDDW